MKKLIALSIGVVCFASCNKDKVLPEEISKKTLETAYIVSEVEVKKVGDYHNETLATVFKDFDWDAEDQKIELIKRFQLNKIVLDDFQKEDLELSGEEIENKYVSLLKNKMSVKAYSYVDEVMGLLESTNHCSEFSKDLILLKNKAMFAYENKEFSSTEVNSLLVTFGVFESSARFWAPIESGGTGTGHSVLVKAHSEDGKRYSFNWKNVVTSDGISAGVGMLGVAATGIVGGPIGWISLAVVAGSSATRSAIAGCTLE